MLRFTSIELEQDSDYFYNLRRYLS